MVARRLVPIAAATAAGALLASGCGDEARTASPPPKPPVRVLLVAPADTAVVRAETIEVRGRVDPPAALVRVAGRRASVSAGEFSARVPVDEGANVIDVAATARGVPAGFLAVRVTRDMSVVVPDLVREPADDAVSRLAGLDLEADVSRDEGFLDGLLPGERSVCESDPEAGERVERGSRVRLVVSKSC